ncbi:MAG: hypothetical protein WD009_02270 [Phycisphaeraceae bacterium]
MLKFFRKYNKLILAIGGSVLMVAFLIQPALDMYYGTPGDRVVGRVDGEEIRMTDQYTAAMEMELLGRMHPIAGQMAQGITQGDPLLWALMVRDARRLGLRTSNMEVMQTLEVLGYADQALTQLSTQTGQTPEMIQQSVRHWLLLDQYHGLILGRTHMAPVERLAQAVNAVNIIQQAQAMGDVMLYMEGQMALAEVEGAQRLSEPVIRHFMYTQQSRVGGEAVLIASDRYTDEVDAPSEAELAAHFEQYRDVHRGRSEPYGFGYMLPPRVRIEYLTVPIDAAVTRIEEQQMVEEVDVLAYYNENEDDFRAPETGEVADYGQVHGEIVEILTRRAADELAQQAIRTAQSLLVRDARGVAESRGYRVLPEDFEPTDLDAVAAEVASRVGIEPVVERRVDAWVALGEVETLPGLGDAVLEDRPDLPLTAYVASVRELEPGEENPLVVRRLQVGLASSVLRDQAGSRYIFRVRDAEPAREPASLDEVRDEVEADVRRLKAHERLVGERSQWLERARSEGLEALAESEGLELIEVPLTARRVRGLERRLVAPSVPGIGRSEAFVGAIFNLAQELAAGGDVDLASRDEAERVSGVPLDHVDRQGLALFRVDAYEPLSRQQYVQALGVPAMAATVDEMLWSELVAADGPDASLSMEAVSRRLGFEPAAGFELEDEQPPAQPGPSQRRPGTI